MKLIYLIGLPGCGKSTVMKQFMEAVGGAWKTDRPVDLLDSHVSGDYRVLGKYEEGEVFSGTDRLSMAVSPKAVEFLGQTGGSMPILSASAIQNRISRESCRCKD